MADIIRKVIPCEVKKVKERTYEFTASTEDIDRDGEVIEAAGWQLANFKKNPVIMFAHNYYTLPVGRAPKVWVEGKALKNHVEFPEAGTYDFADICERMVDKGFLRAESVGFLPDPDAIEQGDGKKKPRQTYKKQELLEISLVPVPSQPNALMAAKNAGVITDKEFEYCEGEICRVCSDVGDDGGTKKPEETDEYFRIPVKGEEGKHDGHKIRTIDVSKEKGIKALYCIDCKKIITYLFSKDDKFGWTMESAQDWVDEHAETAGKEISQAEIMDELDYLIRLIDTKGMNDEVKEDAWNLVRKILRIAGSEIPDDILAKVGAVLSKKNKANLKEAQNLIQGVLDNAETEHESVNPTAEEIEAYLNNK